MFIHGEEAEFVFGLGTQILPTLGADIYGRTTQRVVLDSGQRWFEIGFRMDLLLSGNAATGWTDPGNYFRIEPQWSLDLVTWEMGKFLPAPVPVVDIGGGVYEYWSRAIHPVDSAVKSGALFLQSGMSLSGEGKINSDARNNPFLALTVDRVSLALGGFPYTMPADAARMQADLGAIYPGATITAASATVWQIAIPAVGITAFGPVNKLWWPGYLVPDLFGNLTQTVDGGSFFGVYVNEGGVPIYPRAFARLKITAGTRYDPFS